VNNNHKKSKRKNTKLRVKVFRKI